MGKFAAGVDKWGEKALREFEELRKAVIFELFVSVILDTPVDSGRLRGNWQVSVESFSGGELTFTKTDPGQESKSSAEIKSPRGPVTLDRVKAVESVSLRGRVDSDKTVFLTNNLPYAYRIEYDGWSHTKAPKGMVRKNFIRVSNNLKRKVA